MLKNRKMSAPRGHSSESTVVEETTSINNPMDTKKLDIVGDLPPLSTKISLTCNFGDLPNWLQDNVDILRGYRRPTFSYIKCAQSLFYIHNESINIWSHLVGALGFVFLAFTTYFYVLSGQATLNWLDFMVFYIFLSGAMVCLGFSSTFHTVCCHSEEGVVLYLMCLVSEEMDFFVSSMGCVCATWNRCDYIGIVTLIVGSFYPMIYYGFYCHDLLKIVYLTLITIFGIATIFVAVSKKFRSPNFRWFRTGLFLAMGLSAIVPLAHAIVIYGVRLCFNVISLKWLLLMGGLYVTGALIYGSRIPERWYPGVFDIYGSSHQIFHFFVISAALVHYYGVTQAMKFWHENNHDCQLSVSSMQGI